jgi:putative ABC transport system substrate-binding protein
MILSLPPRADRLRRRALILASGACAALVATRAAAQQLAPRRIGWLTSFSAESERRLSDAFVAKLKELGYVEGRDFTMEYRFTGGKGELLPGRGRELLALGPALIVTTSSPATAAMKKETRSVPIVFANVGEPVEQGFVESLARPGGNVTGTTFRFELFAKLVDLVRETLPAAQRIALLEDERFSVSKRVTMRVGEAASALGYKLHVARVKGEENLDAAFTELVRLKVQALLLPPQLVREADKIAERAAQARLPTFGNLREFSVAGALLSNYNDWREAFQRAAVMAHRILKGAKAADLPVEEAERLYLIVNLRTARALGITIPRSVLLRADEVIE